MADTPPGTTTDHHQPADASTSLRVLVVDDHALVSSERTPERTRAWSSTTRTRRGEAAGAGWWSSVGVPAGVSAMGSSWW